MRRVGLLIAACVMTASFAWSAGGADEDDKEPNVWMKNKLRYSQGMLTALMSEDFEAIGKNANAMNRMAHLEKWIHAKKSDYKAQLKVFGEANVELIAKAGEEDLKGTTQAFLKLTQSCVDCHKIVREGKRK